jgi:broad specificity phosphatase PhoE
MSSLYFIRHGQASFGAGNYDRLSDLGISQSRILGEYLASLGVVFDEAYTGEMARQGDTARMVLGARPGQGSAFPVEVRPEFNEYSSDEVFRLQLPAVLEAEPHLRPLSERIFTDRKAFQLIFEKTMMRWISGRHDLPGCETWVEFSRRVRRGVERIMEESGRGRTVALFSSGGPLCILMQKALDLTDESALRVNWTVKNASVTVFLFNGNRLTLSSFNSTAHLEQQKDPKLLTYR